MMVFIGLVNIFYKYKADKFYNQLLDSLELLASFPQTGRTAYSIYPGLRRIEFNPCVLFFMPRDYGIYVIRLLKQSQIAR